MSRNSFLPTHAETTAESDHDHQLFLAGERQAKLRWGGEGKALYNPPTTEGLHLSVVP
jgi:hypothetical protein